MEPWSSVVRCRIAQMPAAPKRNGAQCLGLVANVWIHMAVGQNQWYHFGVGAPPILVFFSGDWDVDWGYGILTHGHIALEGQTLLLLE